MFWTFFENFFNILSLTVGIWQKMFGLIFWIVRLCQECIEFAIYRMNIAYILRDENQVVAENTLGISKEDMRKSVDYCLERRRFGTVSSLMKLLVFALFCWFGGFSFIDHISLGVATNIGRGEVAQGLVFFAILGFLNFIFDLPFSIYSNFVIEEKHGFNRQNFAGFFSDQGKGLVLGALLGGLLLACLLSVMQVFNDYWWLWAWGLVSSFSVLIAWIFPTILAPLFNKFSPLVEGELKRGIEQLAVEVDFPASDVSIMDASRRSSHGNAYFTGVFGKKKIVLFDTLVSSLSPKQVIAVLAHELGHFKLRHVRLSLARSIIMTGLVFYVISRCMSISGFYTTFGFEDVSSHAALIVFSVWFGLISFYFLPLQSWLSRRNEFAADSFAKQYSSPVDLASALIKLSETSRSMPISHPIYSAIYHSHPPLLERIIALRRG